MHEAACEQKCHVATNSLVKLVKTVILGIWKEIFLLGDQIWQDIQVSCDFMLQDVTDRYDITILPNFLCKDSTNLFNCTKRSENKVHMSGDSKVK